MAVFKKKNSNSVLPEVDEYYQAERRDRGWLAWLLAIISVIVVVLIVIALFFAGRWLVDTINGDDNNEQVGVSVNDGATNSNDENIKVDGGAAEPVVPENEPESKQTDSSTGNQNDQGTVQAPAQTETPSSTPVTGDDELPSTGPASLVSTFLAVSIVAGGLHYVVSRKRISN